jgi:hypothetical protein
MSLYHSSKQKLRNILRTIESLLEGDFPISSGKDALIILKKVFLELDVKIERANKLDQRSSTITVSNNINLKISQYLPILGFILRSTNVRNAFELLDPLQDIAEKVLGGNPQLLLSSEWDYVPFAFPQTLEDLKSFILIGMPASEAASSLLLPLAGHELGHAVWRNRGIEGAFSAKIQENSESAFNGTRNFADFRKQFPNYDPDDFIAKQISLEVISEIVTTAVFQTEEIFCDIFAYAVFGESYVHAFAYILAPGFGSVPGSSYPSNRARIDALRSLALKEGATLPDIRALNLNEHDRARDPQERFILRIAEESAANLVDELWETVLKILTEGNVSRPNSIRSKRHLHEISQGIPSHQPNCLGDIVNAGWSYYKQVEGDGLNISDKLNRFDTLNEIMLKSIEVLEYNRRISCGP